MTFTVYVCAPYSDAAFVRSVHDRLRKDGFTPVSAWAEHASEAEDFSRLSPEALRFAAEANDQDLRGTDAVLVLARDGSGGEMFAEARLAIEWNKPVVWCGRRLTISAFRPGVVRFEDLNDALASLTKMKAAHTEGCRGQLLVHLARGVAA